MADDQNVAARRLRPLDGLMGLRHFAGESAREDAAWMLALLPAGVRRAGSDHRSGGGRHTATGETRRRGPCTREPRCGNGCRFGSESEITWLTAVSTAYRNLPTELKQHRNTALP